MIETGVLPSGHPFALVISGGRDAAYPPPLVDEMVASLPNARHIVDTNAGHGGGGARFAADACFFLAGQAAEADPVMTPAVANRGDTRGQRHAHHRSSDERNR